MKKNSRFAGFYMGLIFFLMYLPIAVVIVFSFNESKLPVKFTGFSLKWYQELFHDRAMLEALVNSLILGVLSCLASAGNHGQLEKPSIGHLMKNEENHILSTALSATTKQERRL